MVEALSTDTVDITTLFISAVYGRSNLTSVKYSRSYYGTAKKNVNRICLRCFWKAVVLFKWNKNSYKCYQTK